MATETTRRRAHVVLPRELIDEIDAIVETRGRSRFLQEAAEFELERRRRVAAFERVRGSIADGEVPEWDTPESTSAWIDELRRGWDGRPAPSSQ